MLNVSRCFILLQLSFVFFLQNDWDCHCDGCSYYCGFCYQVLICFAAVVALSTVTIVALSLLFLWL